MLKSHPSESHGRNVILNVSGALQFRFGSGNKFKQSEEAEEAAGRVSGEVNVAFRRAVKA